MVKKGFLKKTGCILVSVSIILTGWTFFGSSTSDAGLDAGVFTFTADTPSVSSSEYRNNTAITMVEGDEGVTASIGANAFEGCSNLISVKIKGNASVGELAFLNDSALTHFEVGGSASIGQNAFKGCTNLSTFTVNTLQSINKNAFSDCKALTTIKIENGGTFKTYDGALYQDTTLIYVPAAKKSLTIPDGTTAIAAGAFADGNVYELTFVDAKDITSFDTNQGDWPYFNPKLYVSAIGGGGTNSPIQNFFDEKIADRDKSTYEILYDNGESGGGGTTPSDTTYDVTVKEIFYAKDGTTELKTNTITRIYDIGTTNDLPANDYSSSGYALKEGQASSVQVSGATTVTFEYIATVDDPDDPVPVTPTNYTINVTETFYNYSGKLEGSRTNSSLTGTYTANSKITAASYTNYNLTSGNSPYTVTKDDTVQFVYKATTSSATSPISDSSSSSSSTTKKKYKVTVYDVFYDSAVTKVTKTTTRLTDTYEEGQTYNYEARTYTGYTWFDAEYQSGTVYSDRKVKFFYKATSDSKSSSSSSSSGTTKNKSGGNAGITASEKAQTTELYKITKGAGQTVGQNDGPVEITCNGELNKLLYILVDGAVLNSSNYTVKSGSTILTLTKEYIASLPTGDHAVQFQYDDGYALTGLRITGTKTTTTVTYKVSSDGSISSGHTKDTTPKTADGFDARYLLCLAIFLLGAGAILMGRQKNLEAILASQREDY